MGFMVSHPSLEESEGWGTRRCSAGFKGGPPAVGAADAHHSCGNVSGGCYGLLWLCESNRDDSADCYCSVALTLCWLAGWPRFCKRDLGHPFFIMGSAVSAADHCPRKIRYLGRRVFLFWGARRMTDKGSFRCALAILSGMRAIHSFREMSR